jgi:hypothetical protein
MSADSLAPSRGTVVFIGQGGVLKKWPRRGGETRDCLQGRAIRGDVARFNNSVAGVLFQRNSTYDSPSESQTPLSPNYELATVKRARATTAARALRIERKMQPSSERDKY